MHYITIKNITINFDNIVSFQPIDCEQKFYYISFRYANSDFRINFDSDSKQRDAVISYLKQRFNLGIL